MRVPLLAVLACAPKLTSVDDIDVGSFACDGALSGERAIARRILEAFGSGGAFSSPPAKGIETWFGRKVCTDTLDAPRTMVRGKGTRMLVAYPSTSTPCIAELWKIHVDP